MEMHDLGRKDTLETVASPQSNKKTRINYPGFSIKGEQISQELKDAPVGSKCRLEIIVRKVGDGIETYGDREQRVEFEVLKLGYIGKAGKMSKEEYLAASDEEREKNDRENTEEGEEENAE